MKTKVVLSREWVCRSDLRPKADRLESTTEKNVECMWVLWILEKLYDRINGEALWQLLRMYDVGGKLLSGIKSMYVDSLACVRVKGGETE